MIAGREFDAREFETGSRMICVEREQRMKMRIGFGKAGAFHECLGETEARRVVGGGKFLHGKGEVGKGKVGFLFKLDEGEEVAPAGGSWIQGDGALVAGFGFRF